MKTLNTLPTQGTAADALTDSKLQENLKLIKLMRVSEIEDPIELTGFISLLFESDVKLRRE